MFTFISEIEGEATFTWRSRLEKHLSTLCIGIVELPAVDGPLLAGSKLKVKGIAIRKRVAY